MRIVGEITQKHIKRGKRGNPNTCPLALSLKDQGFISATVLQFDFSVATTDARHYGALTKKLVDWVMDYDETKPVKPIRYQLRVGR